MLWICWGFRRFFRKLVNSKTELKLVRNVRQNILLCGYPVWGIPYLPVRNGPFAEKFTSVLSMIRCAAVLVEIQSEITCTTCCTTNRSQWTVSLPSHSASTGSCYVITVISAHLTAVSYRVFTPSSKLQANVFKIHVNCWTFAGSCKHHITNFLQSDRTRLNGTPLRRRRGL